MHQYGGGAEREAGLLSCDGEQLLELLHDGLVVEGQDVRLPLPGETELVAGGGQQPYEVKLASAPQGQEVIGVKHRKLF